MLEKTSAVDANIKDLANHSSQAEIDSAFQCFALWLSVNRIEVSPENLRKDYGKAEHWNSSDIIRAAKYLFDLKVKRIRINRKKAHFTSNTVHY